MFELLFLPPLPRSPSCSEDFGTCLKSPSQNFLTSWIPPKNTMRLELLHRKVDIHALRKQMDNHAAMIERALQQINRNNVD